MSDNGTNGGGQAPAGWYPDGQGGQRWWDGSAWAEPGQGPADPAAGAAPAGAEPTTVMPTAGAPMGAPEPAKKKTGLIIGLVGGLVAIIAVVVVLLLVLGGGSDDKPSSSDPVKTVENFIDAGQDGDCDAALNLVTDKFKDQMGADCGSEQNMSEDMAKELGIDPDDIDYEIGKADIDGDSATVPVTVSFGDAFEDHEGAGLPAGMDGITVGYQLVKEDGAWLIDGFDLGDMLGGLMPDGMPTDFMSDLPTDIPTDFLSDLPTDFPTDFMSDLPTDLFSDFPTDFPTDFLTDLPTDFPTS